MAFLKRQHKKKIKNKHQLTLKMPICRKPPDPTKKREETVKNVPERQIIKKNQKKFGLP